MESDSEWGINVGTEHSWVVSWASWAVDMWIGVGSEISVSGMIYIQYLMIINGWIH
jgi:hypothetical protein